MVWITLGAREWALPSLRPGGSGLAPSPRTSPLSACSRPGVAEQFAITEATLSAWSSLDDGGLYCRGAAQDAIQLQGTLSCLSSKVSALALGWTGSVPVYVLWHCLSGTV